MNPQKITYDMTYPCDFGVFFNPKPFHSFYSNFYLRLLEIFHAAGAVDQAIQLAETLKADSLHLPQFHDMFGYLIEPLLGQAPGWGHYGMQTYTFSPQLNSFVPVPVPGQHYPMSPYHQPVMYPHPFYIPPAPPMQQTESPQESESGVSTPSPMSCT